MAWNHHDQGSIRRYLLNQLTEDQQEQIEQRLLTDDELFDQLQAAEDELVDQYLAGALSKDETKMFEKHFLVTPERQEKLRFAKAFRRYVATHSSELPQKNSGRASVSWGWPKFLSASPLRAAAFAALVLISALGVWRIFFYQSDVDKGLLALNSAFREQRPVEARITHLGYAPFVTTRGPETAKFNESELRRAELTLLDALNKNPTPAAHHALGKVYLAKKELDKAIEQFDEALKGDPKNAQLYSDLGAAWLEKGKIDSDKTKADPTNPEAGKGAEELARSLENLTTALELDSNLLEALFNRALCHQYMFQNHAAEEDWREYLRRDPKSGWADEARQNLKRLEEKQSKGLKTKEQLMEGFLNAQQTDDNEKAWEILGNSRDDLAGTNISQQLLVASLESAGNGNDSELRKTAEALAYLGELERAKAGEYYNENLASLYKSLTPTQRVRLTQAHSSMESGYEHYRSSRLSEAIEEFTKARATFDAANDHEESSLAQYWTGYCHAEAGQTEPALAIFQRLAEDCQTRSYKWLQMRTLSSLSSVNFSLNEYSKAIDYSTQALELAEQIGDNNGSFNALDTLIEIHRSLSNHSQALTYIERSLPLIDCCPFNPVKVWRHHSIIAATFSSAGLYHAAIDYQKEAVERALAVGETSMVCVSYAHLGSMYGKIGKYDVGVDNIKLAFARAAQRQDESTGKKMMAYSSLQFAHLYREGGKCDAALMNYDRSIALYEALALPVFLYQAHKGRLICYLAQSNDLLANEEIQTTLSLAEKYRSTILEGNNRNSFFGTEQSLYDLATDFAYSRLGDSEKAFNYTESSRARSLLDSMNAQSAVIDRAELNLRFEAAAAPLPLSKIQPAIPADVQIIEYSVLSEKLLIAIVDQQGLKIKETSITQNDLEQKVRLYLKLISNPSDAPSEARSLAKELYQVLLYPAESLLDKEKQIIVIPDKLLNLLPFNALISPASNRYLIEDYCLSYSPSVAVFLRATKNAEDKAFQSRERLLSVGNPTFDHDVFPFLDDLPAATREAQEITRYYKSARSLVGPAALKGVVKSEMLDADVVHFAAHAISDDASGLRSRLVLAKQQEKGADKSSGVFQAYEIYSLTLPRTKVVVLSACQSGTGRQYSGEGSMSLARPFLVSGVPVVVASLWPVDSDSTADLMISFHKHRTQGKYISTAEALRQAQLDMLAQANERLHRPYFWAAFFALGGRSSF